MTITLPGNPTFKDTHLSGYTPSVGTTPVALYFRVPFRCELRKVASVLGGTITAADAACAVAANGGSTLFTHTIVQSGSAAGKLNSTIPSPRVFLNEDDVISITPSGATGSNIPAHFQIAIRQA